jgi:hypothetical protein
MNVGFPASWRNGGEAALRDAQDRVDGVPVAEVNVSALDRPPDPDVNPSSFFE